MSFLPPLTTKGLTDLEVHTLRTAHSMLHATMRAVAEHMGIKLDTYESRLKKILDKYRDQENLKLSADVGIGRGSPSVGGLLNAGFMHTGRRGTRGRIR